MESIYQILYSGITKFNSGNLFSQKENLPCILIWMIYVIVVDVIYAV